MNGAKVLEVIVIYKKKFDHMGVKKIDYPHNRFLPIRNFRSLALAHCNGMFEKMEEFARAERMDKVFRWLGFVQGVLWVCRVYTLEELKNHNRPTKED